MINNATFLSSPVSDEVDLRNRLQSAVEDASADGLPWALYVYEPYLGGIDPEHVRAMAAELKLEFLFQMRVMTADSGALAPPVRPLPQIEFRRVETREDIWRVLELNMRCYGLPLEMAESVMETGAYFSDPAREVGILGLVDGEHVSTASVVEIKGWLYLYLVATDPEHRRKGYAEALMRQALAIASSERGITRTSLDASGDGASLYHHMGYEYTGETWGIYLSS